MALNPSDDDTYTGLSYMDRWVLAGHGYRTPKEQEIQNIKEEIHLQKELEKLRQRNSRR